MKDAPAQSGAARRSSKARFKSSAPITGSPVPSYEVVANAVRLRRLTSAIGLSRFQAAWALEEARRIAKSGCGLLRTAFPQWRVRAEVVAGTLPWAIIEAAERLPADLVVIGTHGRSALRGLQSDC